MATSVNHGSTHAAKLSSLEQRLEALRKTQNPDGGWGYFQGKASWLEPTAYAAMALHGEPAADRAYRLLSNWQTADGGWKPNAQVSDAAWGTSLCVTLALGRNEVTDSAKRGVAWLVNTCGAESSWLNIAVGWIRRDRDFSLKAWPWKSGNAGWVEPTSHALVALKQALNKADALKISQSDIRERIASGEAQLFSVRSGDGGWNYGSSAALGVDLTAFPETTALALLGLQGNHQKQLDNAFALAYQQLEATPSPMGAAWLALAERAYGRTPRARTEDRELTGDMLSDDLMITAIEALAAPEGNHWFMRAGLRAA